MATNGFLSFASGVGAQVMSQSDYESKAAIGVTPGIADYEFANKTWLQSSLIAAALGGLIATDIITGTDDNEKTYYTGQDTGDTLTETELQTQLSTVFLALAAQQADIQIDEAFGKYKPVFYTEQTDVTDAEKLQARTNIGAACEADIIAICDEIAASATASSSTEETTA